MSATKSRKVQTRTIRQNVAFRASPHEVYELLMDSKKHTELSGSKSIVSRRIGGKISISDGYITGANIELEPDEKIVQSWKAEEDCWPVGHWSKVTFLLKATKSGTRLRFSHTGVPVECGDRFDSGWKEFYWVPMKEMLEKKPGTDSK